MRETLTLVPELHRPAERPAAASATEGLAARVNAAWDAQRKWSQWTVGERLRVVRSIRHQIVERSEQLVSSVTCPYRNGAAETLAGELIPLADACKFLEHEAPSILASRRLSRRSRPLWLRGVSVELQRDPFGIVLIVAASNYPLFLPGVHALQALVAGNAVLLKPGIGATLAARTLAETFVNAGLDESLLQVLPEDRQWVEAAIDVGVNKVVLTGSAETGRNVQSLLTQSLTPSVMELSGCDAVFVLDSANLQRVAQCLAFGLQFNQSATCIAPRRVFVTPAVRAELEERLCEELNRDNAQGSAQPLGEHVATLVTEAIGSGARAIAGEFTEDNGVPKMSGPTVLTDATPELGILESAVFAPVTCIVPVKSIEEALQANLRCPYALGAVVFGEDRAAQEVAKRVNAGCVVINDMIAPTADPRIPFGGRGQSGFGVTRGAAGLEEMTQLKAVVHQRSGWLPHLDETTPFDAKLLSAFLGMSHGRDLRQRIRSAWSAVRAATEQQKWKKQQGNRRPKDGR